MRPHTSLTHDELEALFAWLDPDRDQAIAKYETIRRGLIDKFIVGSCVDPEALADETIDRVIKRLPEISAVYEGNPISYFYGVARKVLLEYFRKRRRESRRAPVQTEPRFGEKYYECLESCLDQLEPEKRELIVRYYAEQKRAKIESRKVIRSEMSLKADALRVRTFRIRRTLKQCVFACVEGNELI
jgi:DNA-directed RNA polymerase specialized sigma24 family protein